LLPEPYFRITFEACYSDSYKPILPWNANAIQSTKYLIFILLMRVCLSGSSCGCRERRLNENHVKKWITLRLLLFSYQHKRRSDDNITLTISPRRSNRDISDIPPRHPHFTKTTNTYSNICHGAAIRLPVLHVTSLVFFYAIVYPFKDIAHGELKWPIKFWEIGIYLQLFTKQQF
jgi:hypothetical protein